jgi:hypothetical protein
MRERRAATAMPTGEKIDKPLNQKGNGFIVPGRKGRRDSQIFDIKSDL